jgi:hypothetical protein
MPNLLSFRKGSRLKKKQSELRFYELQADWLSVDGRHPRRGDVCSVSIGEQVIGEPHIVSADGKIMCGRLFYEGRNVVLKFPNPAFPTYREDERAVEVIGRVENFYCTTEGAIEEGLRLSGAAVRQTAGERIRAGRSLDLDAYPVQVAGGVPNDSIINWRADAAGRILFASETWRAHLTPLADPRTWNFIKFVHPEQRREVAIAWSRAVKNRTHFDVTCSALLLTGYQPIRNMAVPVRNPANGEDEWMGTLHLLSRAEATGS